MKWLDAVLDAATNRNRVRRALAALDDEGVSRLARYAEDLVEAQRRPVCEGRAT